MRRLAALTLAAALQACAQVEVPVWIVRADRDLSIGDGEQAVSEVLDDLHWDLDHYDPDLRLVLTRWRYRDGLWGGVRSRAELRLSPDAPFLVAATVPREVHDGRQWVLRGEDEDPRRELIAALSARLNTPRPEP